MQNLPVLTYLSLKYDNEKVNDFIAFTSFTVRPSNGIVRHNYCKFCNQKVL